MDLTTGVQIAFLVAIVLFIFGIKRLGKVRTARSGNTYAWLAMLIATLAALVSAESFVVNWAWIAGAGIGGALVGAVAARRVAMTDMPEMVALFNGSGGIASLLVALAALWGWGGSGLAHEKATLNDAILQPQHVAQVLKEFGPIEDRDPELMTAERVDAAILTVEAGAPEIRDSKGPSTSLGLVLSILIGGITLSGSFVAYGKLSGKISGNAIVFPGQHALNGLLLISAAVLAGWMAFGATAAPMGALSYLEWLAVIMTVLALVLGVTLVIPIGGADMPVVISLLNSYSGLAASMTGFVLQNTLLIVSGAMVGAAGLILTAIMCKAMNRSLLSVLMGGFGATSGDSGPSEDARDYKNITKTTAEELAMMLDGISSVVFVPGYGLAVAQAQHVVRELSDMLVARDIEITYAIHPVAGRMPGHMNVLLAEANVPYEQLIEMDQINPQFKTTDLAIILGANDVVNPAALDEPESPLAGMPILMVHEAANVVVIKRSLSPGYAGVKNKLFEKDNTLMLFGDAKVALQECLNELKDN